MATSLIVCRRLAANRPTQFRSPFRIWPRGPTQNTAGCFLSLGRLLGEFSQLPYATPQKLRQVIEYDEVGLAHLREAEKNKRGVIFLTGHLGVWELHSFGWSALEYPLSFLVRPLDNPRIEEMIDRVRTRFGNRAIDKKSAARQSLRVLREGGTLGILSDLNTQPYEGVFVPFFGKLACTTAGIATLALKTDAVVIPTCAVWDKNGSATFSTAIRLSTRCTAIT